MRNSPILHAVFLLSSACFCLAQENTAITEIKPKVAAAKAILNAWENTQPKKELRKLHIVLWTPQDRDPAPLYRERLTAIMLEIQKFYGDEMERIGFGRRSINLDLDDRKQLNIHVVKGRKPYSAYAGDSGNEIRTECIPTLTKANIDRENETIVIFCNMSNWDEKSRTITQNSPYYAGGNHAQGTAWQVDSAILNLADLADKGNFVKDGQYGRISMGQYNSIFIGGVCHELGHALGLPHNSARADESAAFGTALMGSGNRTFGEQLRGESKGSFLTLAHALRLASHPQFSGSVKGINIRANAEPKNLKIEQAGKGFRFSGSVQANPPVYAVLGYMDPDGGGDYDAPTTTAIPDENGNFSLDCQSFEANKSGELRVFFVQANGAVSGYLSDTPYRYPYLVNADGQTDISFAQTKMLLQPLATAINRGDEKAAAELVASTQFQANADCVEIAKRILDANKKALIAPADVAEDVKSLPLADLLASSEKVGYGKSLRDRVPAPDVIMQAGQQFFRHGIFAHAAAEHEWQLDGKWKMLKGQCGNVAGHQGELRFVIEGDGKVLWDSKTVKAGQCPSYEVNIEGVSKLTLRTSPGDDGMGNDWATWFEPTLSR